MFISIYIYIYKERERKRYCVWGRERERERREILHLIIYIYKLATVAEVDSKIPFSIAATPRFRERRYFFPWIASLTFDPYIVMLNVKQGGIKYYFFSLWYDSTWN